MPDFSADEANLPPVHPGEILLEEFMKPLGFTAYGLAKRLHLPRARVERLSRGETSVSPDTALRLGRALGTTPEFWMTLQSDFDLRSPEIRMKADLDAIEPIRELETA